MNESAQGQGFGIRAIQILIAAVMAAVAATLVQQLLFGKTRISVTQSAIFLAIASVLFRHTRKTS